LQQLAADVVEPKMLADIMQRESTGVLHQASRELGVHFYFQVLTIRADQQCTLCWCINPDGPSSVRWPSNYSLGGSYLCDNVPTVRAR
jgi:hypothetical protein